MKIDKKTKIAVLCGGKSSEREISLRSGKNCFNALESLGYNSILVDIKTIEDLLDLKHKNIEVAFLVTHGKFGEDGTIQGILEWLQIPYTGSSVLGSALSMDKWLTKQIAQNNKIDTPNSYLLTRNNKNTSYIKDAWEELSKKSKAVFLKPRDEGSSVNTFKIKSLSELEEKISKIDLTVSDYLIEEYISGREITVSILEVEKQFKVLPILELKPKADFYDYHAKYTKGMTEFILPANLDKDSEVKIGNISKTIFSLIGCSSFGRVDYIVDEKNIPYLLEVNSLPGMTDTSDLPAQAACAEIKYNEVVEMVLKTARLHNISKDSYVTQTF